MNAWIRLTLASLLWLGWGVPASAQSPTARARISPQTAYVGEALSYVITLDDVKEADAPTIQPVDGLRFSYAGGGPNSQISIINGRRSESHTYVIQYTVVATRAGDFEIPPQTVMVGGAPVRTNAAQFRIVEPPESEKFALRATVERSSLYVGEPTTLQVTWYIAAQPRSFEFIGDLDGLPLESYAKTNPRTRNNPDQATALFDGEQVTGDVGQETLDGQAYTTFTIERTIVPTRAGEIEIPPITVAFDEVVGTRGSGIFRDERTERRVARSRPVTLNVRPLPMEGRPANFNGLIGRYDIGAVAEPLDVNVGDPISLRAVVTGPEPLARVPAPDIEDDPSFLEDFKPSPDGWSGATTPGGARTFTTTVRATNESVDAIPPIELPYFDTELGEYRVARSNPIPLTVRATREVTAADAIGGGGVAAPIARTALDTGSGGVRAIFTSPAALASQRAPVLDRMSSPAWIAVGATPPAAYLALAAFLAIRKREDASAARRRQAQRRALSRLAGEGAAHALRGYLADHFDAEEDTLTAWDGRESLAPIDAALAEEAYELLAASEAGRFGGEGREIDAERTRELIRRIEKETRR
jgi:hypothetical protein